MFLGKFQSLENLLYTRKDNTDEYCSLSNNELLLNGYGGYVNSTAINTLDYFRKKISEENFLTNKNSNKNFTEKAKNFIMRDTTNANFTKGHSINKKN